MVKHHQHSLPLPLDTAGVPFQLAKRHAAGGFSTNEHGLGLEVPTSDSWLVSKAARQQPVQTVRIFTHPFVGWLTQLSISKCSITNRQVRGHGHWLRVAPPSSWFPLGFRPNRICPCPWHQLRCRPPGTPWSSSARVPAGTSWTNIPIDGSSISTIHEYLPKVTKVC